MTVSGPLSVTAANGVPFTVRLVRKGDHYGLDGCLVHDEDDPLVEFYDARYPHTEYGQFVSRYYLSTLLDDPVWGLDLDGGVEDWTVDGDTMSTVYVWLVKEK